MRRALCSARGSPSSSPRIRRGGGEMLVDSHCHLDLRYYPNGIAEALERARQAGVGLFVGIGVGEDLGAARDVVELASERSDVVAVVGVHPHDARCLDESMAEELTRLVERPRVVAV